MKEDREAVEIHAVEAEPVVRELLARDARLSGLEVTSAGLEEAFLALTQDSTQTTEIMPTEQLDPTERLKEKRHEHGNAHEHCDQTEPQIQRSPRHTATIYLKEAKYEFLKNLRLRMYTASVLSFPDHVLCFVRAGAEFASRRSAACRVPTYLIATYGTFGVMGASLFGTAAGLASDRGLGWLQVKRASPMPPFAYFAAKVITSMIFSAIIVLALFTLGSPAAACACRSASSPSCLGTLVAGFAAVFGHGTGSRIFHRTELRARDHQPDLFAHVVLQRTVGAVHVPAESRAADRAGAAALSLVAAGAGSCGRGTPRIDRHALGSAAGLHHDLPGRRTHWLPARPGKNVRLESLRQSWKGTDQRTT